MAKLIKGSLLSREVLGFVEQEVKRIHGERGVKPGLVTIMAGNNPASVSYVSLKVKAAIQCGFHEVQENLPEDVSETDLLALVKKYNEDDAIHGVLVQLPLPKHINEQKILLAIDPDKDVDGQHPVNLGRLVLGGTHVRFPPCTPAGIQYAIRRAGVLHDGVKVTIVGRSNLVGKPLAIMLMQKQTNENPTVRLCNSATSLDVLKESCLEADVLVVAAGSPDLVKGDWVKPGACVIDVGVNRVGERVSAKTGKPIAILRGDVEFDVAKERAAWITPVPGGVGPLTICFLMRNTLNSMRIREGILEGGSDNVPMGEIPTE